MVLAHKLSELSRVATPSDEVYDETRYGLWEQ